MCAAIRSAVSFDMFDVDGSGTLDIAKLNKGGSSAQRASDLIKKLQVEREAARKADEDAQL